MNNIKEVIREYRDDGGSDEVAKDAMSELKAALTILRYYAQHKPGCNALIRERDDNGRFARYACNCGLNELKRTLKAGQE